MQFDHRWESLLDPGKAVDYFTGIPRRPVFEPQQSAWSVGQAWWMAELSRVIYRRDGRREFLAAGGLVEQRFFDVGGTQCAVVRPADGVDFAVVVFRGTTNLSDWLTNVQAALLPWQGGGRVHAGFMRALEKIWADLESCLDAVQAPWFLTGHSLGGALATLAASRRPPTATFTFGAPRVGDPGFVETLQRPLYRVVNHRDVVSSVPPQLSDRRYVHGGQLHYIAADSSLLANPSSEQVAANRAVAQRSLADLIDRRRWFDPHRSLSDHAPVNYVAHLARMLERLPPQR